MSEWQPIETAPKDIAETYGLNQYGNCVLTVGLGMNMFICRWWQRADDPERCNFIAAGGAAVHPTHWMPLPAPPKP